MKEKTVFKNIIRKNGLISHYKIRADHMLDIFVLFLGV